MKHQPTITATNMREINRSAILEFIRRESPVSRSEIAESLNVSLPTVMRIVDQLMEEGLVRNKEKTEWTGGRRRSLLEFNAEEHVVIGIDLGGTKMFGAAADLGGQIITEINLARHGTSGESSFRSLVELIRRLLNHSELKGLKLRGIGIGAPGVTLYREGVVTWAPSLKWRDYPLKTKLEEHFKLPISIDNDVNLAALGELWFGAGQSTRNMALISVGTGIGAGIIIDGALYRGSNEASGEVGYIIPGPEFLGLRYESFGALESLASGTGIAERAAQKLQSMGKGSDSREITAHQVFEAMRQGEEWARSIVEQTVDYLAIAVASVSTILDPEIIVLGGGVARSADLLIEPILTRLHGALPKQPNLVASDLGRRAAVMGAIVNVLHKTGDFFVVRKLS
jgi:glucokinase